MAVRDALVGVDVGTTFTKAVVYTAGMDMLSISRARTPWMATPTGAEVDAHELADATIGCISRALDGAGVERVAALGVTSFGESGVMVDAAGRPVAPIVAWHDRRGQAQAEHLQRVLPEFSIRTGRRADERPSAVKWRWLVENDRITETPVRWFAIAEWIVHCLGGTPHSEASLMSRTGGLDVVQGNEYRDVFAWAGVPDLRFGQIVGAGEPAATAVNGPAALRGATLTVAGLDCYTSAHVIGIDASHTALLSCGTSGAAIRVLDEWLTPPEIRRAVALDFTLDRFVDGIRPAILGATPCGLILQPLMDMLGHPRQVGGTSSQVAGEATDELWRRAFEAVADGEARLIRDLRSFEGDLRQVVAVGGWIAQPRLRSALERRLGDLIAYADATTAADGAARFAAIAHERATAATHP